MSIPEMNFFYFFSACGSGFLLLALGVGCC